MAVTEEKKTEDKKVENEVDQLVEPEEELEEPLLEPEGVADTNPKVHPLAPKGRRFEQVYAEAKQAKRDLATERELRIAAEAKLSVLDAPKVAAAATAEKEYTWAELEGFIASGQITRADAEAHREEVITKRVSSKIKGEFTQETRTAGRGQALSQAISSYVEAVPAIMTVGSDERSRLDEEFDFLASVQGLDASKMDDVSRKALQLTALRTVYGPIDSLVKRNAPVKTETHQGSIGGVRPRSSTNPDQALLDGLTKQQVVHYNKMFRAGRYPGGWKDVAAELKYVAPKRGSR
jgi:hypothetical protein